MKYVIPAFQGTRGSLATPRLVAADDIAVEIYYYGHQIPRSSVRYRAVDGIPPPRLSQHHAPVCERARLRTPVGFLGSTPAQRGLQVC